MPTRAVARTRLGEFLVSEGLLTESAVQRALRYQRETAKRLKIGSILLSWDLVSEDGLLRALAGLYHCQAVTGAMLAAVPLEVANLLSARDAIRLGAIPYDAQKTRIRVGFVNPCDLAAVDEVSNLTGRLCVPGVVTEIRLLQAHRRFYGRSVPFEFRPVIRRLDPGAAVEPRTPADRAGSFLPFGSGDAIEPEAAPAASAGLRPPETTLGGEAAPPQPVAAREPAAPPDSRASGQPPGRPARPAPPPASAAGGVSAESARPAEDTSAARSLWIEHPAYAEDSGEFVSGMWSGSPSLSPSVEDLLELAVGALPPELPRVLLFGEGADCVWGWAGRAEGIPGERLASTRISCSADTLFARVRRTGVPHFGPLSSALWPSELASLLGAVPPPCALFEIRTAAFRAFLYADRGGRVLLEEDRERVARAAATIAELASSWLPPGQRVIPAS